MTGPTLHQVLPTFALHDAIGSHVRRIQRLLRDDGWVSEIFAEDIHHDVRGAARPVAELTSPAAEAGDSLLYHLSTSSPTMTRLLLDRPERLVVDYHNITPAKHFDRWSPISAAAMRDARMQMRDLAGRTSAAIADSTYSARELESEGYPRTTPVPILLDFTDYDVEPHARTLAREQKRRASGGAHWLFVGRMAPNKCQHDVIASFAAYRATVDPRAHLTLVGGATAMIYWRALEGMIDELDLRGAVNLTDSITLNELVAYYRTADVMVCLSEHEGFWVPGLEAMHFGVPVVAFASTAVPETVADAGVLLDEKDPLLVACAVERVLTDERLRAAFVAAGHARVDHFSMKRTGPLMVDALRAAVAGG